MTDTHRHDSAADRREWPRLHQGIKARAQKVRDGQGELLLFSQFPNDAPANAAGYYHRRMAHDK